MLATMLVNMIRSGICVVHKTVQHDRAKSFITDKTITKYLDDT